MGGKQIRISIATVENISFFDQSQSSWTEGKRAEGGIKTEEGGRRGPYLFSFS